MTVAFCPSIIPAILLVSSFAVAAERVTSEQVLPKNTLAFVKIPNAAEFRNKWDRSSFGAMQRDPAFRPFFDDLDRQVDKLTGSVKTTFGIGIKEVWRSLEGEVGVALVHTPGSGFSFVGLAELGEDDQTAARRVAGLEVLLAARGGLAVKLQSGDVEVTSWSIGGEADKAKFSYFRRGRLLVISNDLNTLLAVAASAKKGPEETLSANPVYQHIVDQTAASSGEPALRWYVDPVGALRIAIADNLQGNPNGELIAGLLSQSGIDSFKGIGGSVELASAFADNITRTFGYVEPPVRGLLDALRLPATHQVPPNWVTDDANFYTQINWSGPRFYGAVANIFDSFQGAGAFKSVVGSARLPNTEITYEEAMNNLVGPLHIMANMPRTTGEVLRSPAVLAVGVSDAKKAGEMVRAIAEAAGARPEMVGDHPVYKLRLPSVMGQEIEVAASLAHGTLMVSTNPYYLESVLKGRGTKRPLRQSPIYKQATRVLPEKTSMLSYQRQNGRFEKLYDRLRSGKLQIPLYGGIVNALGLDFGKLPPGAAIRPYFQTSASFIAPADKGFRMIEMGYWPNASQSAPASGE